MRTRAYNPETDYVEIAKWWVDQGETIVPKNLFPTDGVVVEDDAGVPMAMVGVYFFANAPAVALLGFPASNPGYPSRFATHKALCLAVKAAGVTAMFQGKRYLIGWTDKRAVEDAYQLSGMVPGESPCRDFMRILEVD